MTGPHRIAAETRSRLRSAGALLLFAVLIPAAHAQFNGPPTIRNGMEVNRPATLTTDRTLLFPAQRELVLAPGDEVQISLFGQPEYSPHGRIGTEGTIQLPLIGVVKIAGLTVAQAESLIEQDLSTAGMYRQPQVTLVVTQGPNSAVTLIGEVHGVIPVLGTKRLLDVLSAAGGLPATASHVITINRPGVPDPIVVDLGSDPMRSELANIPVFAGDTIVISRIGVVYMVGQFKTPGIISLTPYAPLTLMEATALTGGFQFDAKPGDVRIIRTVGDKRTVVKLDINRVFNGRDPDPILQPNDIVYLPQSTLKVAIEQGGIGTLFGAVSLILTAVEFSRGY
jgi:polysaccharide export outer membrane protein